MTQSKVIDIYKSFIHQNDGSTERDRQSKKQQTHTHTHKVE